MQQLADKLLKHVLDSHFDVQGTQLLIGRVPLEEITERFGTPLFVYDAATCRRQVARLQRALPGFDIYYSVKANPNPAIAQLFFEEGLGLEIASEGELAVALACGCPGDRILFAGPGKTDRDLRAALEGGVREIHVESLGEIRRLDRIATDLGCEVRASIRVNPDEVACGGALNMGGRSTAFGVDEEVIVVAADAIKDTKSLSLTGIHVYSGSQILDCDVLLAMYEHTLEIAESLIKKTQCRLETIDFGGGLGIPYFPGESSLDLETFGENLALVIEEYRQKEGLESVRFMIEPGRFLVGEAGVYAGRVVDRKVSRELDYLVLDGGMNHHLAASGGLGSVVRRNFPIAVAGRIGQQAVGPFQVVGPLCTPLDTLGRKVNLPDAQVGDIVAVFQSGAYGLSASPNGFLSHPVPCEVLVDASECKLIRRRGTVESLLNGTPFDPQTN